MPLTCPIYVLRGGFPREFPLWVMSQLPHGFVYIASFQSTNEHLLTPCGHVFHASFWSQPEWRPCPCVSDIIYTFHSISFIPSLDSTTTSSAFSNRLTTSCFNQPTSLITQIKVTPILFQLVFTRHFCFITT